MRLLRLRLRVGWRGKPHTSRSKGQQGCGAPGHYRAHCQLRALTGAKGWRLMDTQARGGYKGSSSSLPGALWREEATVDGRGETVGGTGETVDGRGDPRSRRESCHAALTKSCGMSSVSLLSGPKEPVSCCMQRPSARGPQPAVKPYSPWMALGGKRTRPTNKLSSSPRSIGDTFRRNRKLPQGRNRGRKY
jgi:hypothetical protein